MKKKFEITKSLVIKTIIFTLLGIGTFFLGWSDVEFSSVLTIASFFTLGLSLLLGANFLLSKAWGPLLISLLVFIVSLGVLKVSYILGWELSVSSEFFDTLTLLFLIFAWSGAFIGALYLLKKRKIWFSIGCVIVFLLPFILYFCLPEIVWTRILTIFRGARSGIFFTVLFLIFGQAIVGFIWKPAQKWGLLVFYMLLGAIIAVVGQVVDYVTRQDVAHYANDAIGSSYGDYGLSDSLHDHAESYQENNKPDESRLNDGYRAVSKYGVGISRRDRIKSYREKEK